MSQHITRNSIRAGTIDNNFTFLDNSGNSNPVTWPTTHPPTPITNSQADATAIAEAIGKVLKTNNSKPKLREPDPFDGSDPCKLRTFILQCKLNFWDRKDAFEDDSDKVNYVLSYLKGTALDCFESAILDPIEPLWLSDFDLFIEELEANFGTYNPIGEAEAELEGLQMHDSHQATKYFIKFQQLATCVQWAMQHSVVRLTTDSQTYQRRYGPPWKAEHPRWTPKTRPSYRCSILGTKRRTLPWNPSFRIFWKQVRTQVRL